MDHPLPLKVIVGNK